MQTINGCRKGTCRCITIQPECGKRKCLTLKNGVVELSMLKQKLRRWFQRYQVATSPALAFPCSRLSLPRFEQAKWEQSGDASGSQTQWKAITDVLHLACLIWHFCGGTAGGRFDASAVPPPAFPTQRKGDANWFHLLVAYCSTAWDKLQYMIKCLLSGNLHVMEIAGLSVVYHPFLAMLLSFVHAPVREIQKSALYLWRLLRRYDDSVWTLTTDYCNFECSYNKVFRESYKCTTQHMHLLCNNTMHVKG